MNVVGIILTSTIFSAIITGFWNNYHIKRNYEHSQKIQTSKYYREIGGEKLRFIIEKWINLMVNTDKYASMGVIEVKKFIGETLNYASPETTKRLARYQQYNYNKQIEHNAIKEHKDYLN